MNAHSSHLPRLNYGCKIECLHPSFTIHHAVNQDGSFYPTTPTIVESLQLAASVIITQCYNTRNLTCLLNFIQKVM